MRWVATGWQRLRLVWLGESERECVRQRERVGSVRDGVGVMREMQVGILEGGGRLVTRLKRTRQGWKG